MPKQSGPFPDRIDIALPIEMRIELITIAYHMGAKGVYAIPAREFLSRGVEAYKKGLSARARRDYEEILANVRIQVLPVEEIK